MTDRIKPSAKRKVSALPKRIKVERVKARKRINPWGSE